MWLDVWNANGQMTTGLDGRVWVIWLVDGPRCFEHLDVDRGISVQGLEVTSLCGTIVVGEPSSRTWMILSIPFWRLCLRVQPQHSTVKNNSCISQTIARYKSLDVSESRIIRNSSNSTSIESGSEYVLSDTALGRSLQETHVWIFFPLSGYWSTMIL